MRGERFLTGNERFLALDDIIVSKTDLTGRITYANRTFLKIAGLTEKDCMRQPHSLIRHPDMPRSIFKRIWTAIEAGDEIFAYIINRAMNGDHYWVYAHVTATRNRAGDIIGYHSNRRAPDRAIVDDLIVPLYARLRHVEREPKNGKQAVEAGWLDQLVPAGELLDRARGKAISLAALDAGAHRVTKLRSRAQTLERLAAAIQRDDDEFLAAIAQQGGS